LPQSTVATAGASVSKYQLNSSTNQWSWEYVLSNVNRLFGNILAINGNEEAIGSPRAATDNSIADASEVEVVDSVGNEETVNSIN